MEKERLDMKKKLLSLFMAACMVLPLAACGGQKADETKGADTSAAQGETTAGETSGKTEADSKAASDASADGKEITLTVMHGRPDPTDTLHQYYLDVQKRYEEKYPNVKVEYEVYDNETYKKKLQIYGSTKSMPDVFFVWSNPSEFLPYVNAGLAAELNPGDFKDFNFTPGALEGATVDGKLLGLPELIDYWYLYVNKKIFEDNNIKIPTTMSELKTAVTELNKAGIAPISMNGKDLWNQSVMFNDILFRYTGGDPNPIWDAASQKTKFAETKEFTEAADMYKELVDMGLFQNSWTSDDEATSKNLFVQGKAAMWYTGTWNNAIATSEDTPQELRDNVAIIPFPSVDGKDTSDCLMGREGVSMMVAENSEYKPEAVNYLKEFFDPDFYPKACWENGIGIPMQKFDQFVKDTDADLLKEAAKSISGAKAVASHPYAFRLNAVFEQECKDLTMAFLLGQKTTDEFWKATDEAAAANQVK